MVLVWSVSRTNELGMPSCAVMVCKCMRWLNLYDILCVRTRVRMGWDGIGWVLLMLLGAFSARTLTRGCATVCGDGYAFQFDSVCKDGTKEGERKATLQWILVF